MPVKDFFGSAGIAHLLENLWNIASSVMDHQLMLQALNCIAICDIQKLNFTVEEKTPELPTIVINIERSDNYQGLVKKSKKL